MLNLILSILSSLAISIILKVSETRGGRRSVVAGSSYISAAVLGLLLAEDPGAGLEPLWMLMGTAVGIGFVAGFMLQMKAIRRLGLAVSISVARIATLGPVVGAMIFYNEQPSPMQTAGIGVGLLSFLLLKLAQRGRRHDGSHRADMGAVGLLALLFVVMIANDFSMKIVQEAGIDFGSFLLFVFATAALICWGRVVILRTKVRRHDLLLGLLLGIPNYLSSWFLIRALKSLGAATVFPTVSAAGVVLTALVAVLFWKERPNRIAWIGIALAAVAVVLLGMPG